MKKILFCLLILTTSAAADPSNRFASCVNTEAAKGGYSAGAGDYHVLVLSARSLIFKCPETYLDFLRWCQAADLNKDEKDCIVIGMLEAAAAIERFKK